MSLQYPSSELTTATTSQVQVTPEEWDRVGTHSESGPYSVDRWLEIYADHCHEHADQIRRARRGED